MGVALTKSGEARVTESRTLHGERRGQIDGRELLAAIECLLAHHGQRIGQREALKAGAATKGLVAYLGSPWREC